VLQLGDEIEVRVDDIDDKGKISLTPTGEGYESAGGGDDAPAREPRRERAPREDRRKNDDEGDGAISVSFEDEFENELSEQLGDLGPGRESGRSREGGNRDGGNRGRRRHR
jgi:polyribonucleotide nucleotidyltransferase